MAVVDVLYVTASETTSQRDAHQDISKIAKTDAMKHAETRI